MIIDSIKIYMNGRGVKALIHTYSDVDMSKCDFATGESVLVVHKEVFEKLERQNKLMSNKIKELQEENKIMRDALEFTSILDNKELIAKLSFEIEELKNENARITQLAIYYKQVLEEIGKCYHPVGSHCVPSCGADIAREVLAKVRNS